MSAGLNQPAARASPRLRAFSRLKHGAFSLREHCRLGGSLVRSFVRGGSCRVLGYVAFPILEGPLKAQRMQLES